MKLVDIKIEELTGESFKPYGDIIDVPNRKPDFSDDESDLWCGIGEVKVEKGASQFCWLDVKRQRPFLCNNLECHINTSETMIPVSGQSVVVVALPEQDSVSLNLPDPKSIKAFFVNGSKVLTSNRGYGTGYPIHCPQKPVLFCYLKREHQRKTYGF